MAGEGGGFPQWANSSGSQRGGARAQTPQLGSWIHQLPEILPDGRDQTSVSGPAEWHLSQPSTHAAPRAAVRLALCSGHRDLAESQEAPGSREDNRQGREHCGSAPRLARCCVSTGPAWQGRSGRPRRCQGKTMALRFSHHQTSIFSTPIGTIIFYSNEAAQGKARLPSFASLTPSPENSRTHPVFHSPLSPRSLHPHANPSRLSASHRQWPLAFSLVLRQSILHTVARVASYLLFQSKMHFVVVCLKSLASHHTQNEIQTSPPGPKAWPSLCSAHPDTASLRPPQGLCLVVPTSGRTFLWSFARLASLPFLLLMSLSQRSLRTLRSSACFILFTASGAGHFPICQLLH